MASRREFLVTSALGAGVLANTAADEESGKSEKQQSAKSSPSGADSKKAAQDVPLAPPDRQSPDSRIPKPVERKIGWAIVGLGKLALEEILPAFGLAEYSQPVALVSGHPDKARQVAEVYDIDPQHIYDYDDYDKLAANDQVEAIYIVLPNNMHAEYTIRGLKAGKHVLCEKPMSVTVKEAEDMVAAAKSAKRLLMIAYRLQYEPYNVKAIELCREQIGTPKLFYASNCQDVAAPNIRLSNELGGGPVGDVGVYCINAARYLTGEQPSEVFAMAHSPKDDGRFREVPESVTFTMRFPSGLIAHCDCSFGTAENRQYRMIGDKGFVDMEPAFSYHSLELRHHDGKGVKNFQLAPANHFTAEMEHFSRCILDGTKPRTPGEEGLADMKVVVAVEESTKTGKTVKI